MASQFGWHSSQQLQQAVRRFHDNYALQPTKALEECKPTLDSLLKIIEPRMKMVKDQKVERLVYGGSAYHGIKVNNDLEFDMDFIMRSPGLVSHPSGQSHSQVFLRPATASANQKFQPIMEDGCVSAEKLNRKFQSILDALKAADDDRLNNVNFRKNGPAIMMQVMRGGREWFRVDLVPVFVLDSGEYCVAKPCEGGTKHPGYRHLWYRSFIEEERQIFSDLDKGNRCRKQAMRVLKVLRNKEAGLTELSSYHLKTILLHDLKIPKEWCAGKLGERVMDLLVELEKALERQDLDHYFMPGVNLFADMEKIVLNNLHGRIKHLTHSEHEMMKALTRM